jgi:hypothetical protein
MSSIIKVDQIQNAAGTSALSVDNSGNVSAAGAIKVDNIQNSTGTSALTIHTSGAITTPTRPFFSARMSTQQDISSGSDITMSFDTVVQNIGSHFDTSTNRFTAPIDGIYYFEASARVDLIDKAADYYRISFQTDADVGDIFWILDPVGYDADITYRSFSINTTFYLEAGNVVRVALRQQGGTSSHAHISESVTYTRFTGYLIG